ncbi:MAG: amino acid-binding protein [Alphaproteobacteria bacterium]|nr:amino acid-binding protein [Alphaproteobacteria bacterium]
MAHEARIAISCPDRSGLISALTGHLFNMGADIGAASFAALSSTAEFTAFVQLPNDFSHDDVRISLAALPELAGAEISVTALSPTTTQAENAHGTHRIEVRGTDRPGLVARLTEAFADFGANIERMDCERVSSVSTEDYIIRIEAWIPTERAETCLAAVDNTAQSLGLSSRAETI